MKKVLITGSNGLLGQSLLNLLLQFQEDYEVFGLARGENRSGRSDFTYVSIDLTDKLNVNNVLERIAPAVIINTAAMTNVDQCEIEKEACTILNVDLVRWLTEYASGRQTQLIQLSTDFIFDGKQGNYKETDMSNPLSYYGLSKLQSEKILQDSKVHYTILRTILVYGSVYDMSRSNIVLWVKASLEAGVKITIVNDQFRMPTYVENLALACKLAMDKNVKGVFHVSSDTLLSIFEIAKQIATTFNLDARLLVPISSSALNQRAQRPAKTGFDLSKTRSVLELPVTNFKEDLQNFKEKITNKRI